MVGVILNLALFFAYHVLWSEGVSGSIDFPSLLLTIAAGVALLRYKRSVMEVIFASALIGLAIKMLAL